ncbi:YbdD/YjiX family protein [Pseudorhodoferax sp.]|uniref:YbdD/YjiX family protein n=1 Tax=Pseudorhodoferax sp. TaxID=1993553 RepID=UPI002DD64049|nr:YbdD/YjiX family protein [Pseudorhodoferax sp.]
MNLQGTGRYLARSARAVGQSLRLMVGLPDYDTYLSHMAVTHPDRAPMSYEEFFKERLEARYGAGKGRCC